jgi:hypothetical protein
MWIAFICLRKGPIGEWALGNTVKMYRCHNEELYQFTPSPNIIRVIKSKEDEMGGHVERM